MARRDFPGGPIFRSVFRMSLRGAERRGNPFFLRQHNMKSNTLGEYEKRNEFALSITGLASFSARTRIAAPVCALVRNDMQKLVTRLRLQGRGLRGMQKAGGVSAVARAWFVTTCRRQGASGSHKIIMARGTKKDWLETGSLPNFQPETVYDGIEISRAGSLSRWPAAPRPLWQNLP